MRRDDLADGVGGQDPDPACQAAVVIRAVQGRRAGDGTGPTREPQAFSRRAVEGDRGFVRRQPPALISSIRPFCSMNFFALSQAPPELDMNSAIITPLASAPASRPPTASAPWPLMKRNSRPIAIGLAIASRPGSTIFCREAWVEIAMQVF